MATKMANQQQPVPGQYFDVPGIGGGTQWTDSRDSTVGLAAALSQTNQVVIAGILPLKQTDVVVDWDWSFTVVQVYTAGTSTLTTSPYAPWNQIGPVKLPVQNQYNSIDVESGIDLYIFNLIRPWRNQDSGTNNLYAAPFGFNAGGTAQGFEAVGNAGANPIVPAQWTTASVAWQNILRLPASITFDQYTDLAITGEPVSASHPAIVSPQYMAGSTRIITPNITMFPGSAATVDNAAVNIGAGTGTFAGSITTTFRRKALYMANPAVLPPVYAWQYRWKTSRFNFNGVSQANFPLPLDSGQILMTYLRMFDPAANGALGAPIQLSALTRLSLQYGSGLFTFDGVPSECYANFLQQHGTLLPPGCIAIDLMLDERGNRSNKRALNTLTTSGIIWHVELSAPTSSTAYMVVGVESLVYVA